MVSKVLLAAAIIIGILGTYGITNYVDAQTKGVQFIAAKVALPAGEVVKAANVKLVDVPLKFAALAKLGVTKADSNLVIGRAPTTDIAQDSIVLYSDFDPVKVQRDLFSRMGKEDRAVSVVVNDATSVANSIEPGDYVDVIGTFKPEESETRMPAALAKTQTASPGAAPGAPASAASQNILNDLDAAGSSGEKSAPSGSTEKGTFTRTLLQRVQVLGVGKRFSDPRYSLANPVSSRYNVVTLKVSPLEAEVVVFAESIGGNLTLALRHPESTQKEAVDRVNFENFTSVAAAPAPEGAK